MLLLGATLLAACDRTAESATAGGNESSREVILYTSADADYARLIVDAFEKRTGIDVKLVGDTEATKTTGLVQRLLAEKDNPRADVWWSSEALGTVELSRAGVFEPYTSEPAEAAFEGAGWPAELRGQNDDWYGFANRARVIVYNTRKYPDSPPARDLDELAGLPSDIRVGIARPQFGTTRSHMAAIPLATAHAVGEAAPEVLPTEAETIGFNLYAVWIRRLTARGVRLYDGNMTVVRAVGSGEIDLGLTDTDDVFAGQRNGWPVAMVPVGARVGPPVGVPGPDARTLVIPNTVALVRGAPNPDAARTLIDFLLSPETERLLAKSDSRNMPVNPALQAEFADLWGDIGEVRPAPVRWEEIADVTPRALEIAERTLVE